MPRYDYKCDECEVVEEVEHSMHEEPTIECPHCGEGMRRIITQAPTYHSHYSPAHPRKNRGRGY